MSSRGVETMAIHILTFLLASAQAAVAGVYQAQQMEVGAAHPMSLATIMPSHADGTWI